MDVTESQLTIALQEAFTCYLAFLTHTQKLRESSLPRQGKGIETTADVSTQQYYQSRVAGIEACLHYTGKIARRVRNWVNYPPEQGYDEGVTVETEVVSLEAFLPDGQETPYLDFFSGCLVQPVTPFSAGPSNNDGEATAKEIDGQGNCQAQSHPRPHISEEDEDDEDDEPDIRERPNVNTASRTSLGIHPNVPIEITSKAPEQFYSASSSIAPSTTQRTPTSSLDSANEAENEDETSDEESEEDESSAEEDDNQAEDSESESQGNESEDSESEDEDEDDTASVTSEMATAFYLQKHRDLDNAEYAKRIYTAEAKQAEDIDRGLAQAKRLADQRAREKEARLLQQKKYAADLQREERERQERIQRDREAALKAQKEQEQWELAALARETAAMRAEERNRREEAEAKRVAEQNRRLKIERERRWAEEIKQRNQALAEEKRKRDAEEAQRRQRERDRRERVMKIDCLACMEPVDRKDIVFLPCRHSYCGVCIKEAFKSAYKSRTPFKCCGATISTQLNPIPLYLSPSFTQKYALLLLEFSTPHPKYCSLPTCSRFLPPHLYNLPTITCPKCKTRTCTACTQTEHPGVCKQDKDGIRVERLAKRKGWKQCPECSQVVERTEGCLHITCRCGAEWCYACLREWGFCGSACGRGARIDEDFRGGEGLEPGGAARIVPLVATAVLMAMMRER